MAETTDGNSPQHINIQTQHQYEFVHYFNVENAKKAAFCLVVGFILYHGVIHMNYGSDSCKWLLSDGRFQGYNAWQPFGCMMHTYSKADSRNCMHYISYWGGKNQIVFLGDSRIRQLFYQFVNILSGEPIKEAKKHEDIHFRDNKINLQVDFLWHPMVNESMYNIYKSWLKGPVKERPNLVITGSATWSIKQNNATNEALDNFRVNLTYTVPYFNRLKNTTKVLWMLQDPVMEELLNGNRSMITNTQVDNYNRAAIKTLMNSAAVIWSSSRLIAQGYRHQDSVDGLHIGTMALNWDVQILMNMYCNDHMNFNDGTCCSSAELITTLQILTAVVFTVSVVVALVMVIYRRKIRRSCKCGLKSSRSEDGSDSSEAENCDNFYNFITAMAKLGVIMAYIFLCDRTNFFMKENKYYTHVNFFLPFSYLMILGFFFTENTEQTQVLHRDMTDEWKGWMQLVILIYHLTGASRMLPIYMQIRVLVSSYLFLSGFGHFFYFWRKGDYSLYRLCQVMFRMNFLVITLCFVMNRPYQFYYFVPLVSFWFFVIYIAMVIWPHITAASAEINALHYVYMILKLAVVTTAITLLYASEVLFEQIFLTHPIKALFVTSDDSIHEWHFRWSLDRYSTTYGLLFAFGYLVGKKFHLFDDSKADALFSRSIVSWLLCGASVVGLLSYAIFTSFCKTKQECNEVHSYIVFIPIVSYIFLRNIPGWLRTKYSAFFAWFGKISLELFISQYHIWLAADTHGVLVLVPSYPFMNVVLTTFIFVCIAHEIQKLTSALVVFAVPKDWKLILRNMFCFAAIMLPIAITHGVLGF